MIRNNLTGQFVKGKNIGPLNPMWRPIEERFWSKVDKNGPLMPNMTTQCWAWLGKPDANGYGVIHIDDKIRKAYRYSYEISKGPIPDNNDLHHICKNPPCVNPDHLEPLSRKEHVHKGESFAAKEARQTHCLRGHPLSGSNLGIFNRPKKPGRFCKTCKLYNEKFRKRRMRYEMKYGTKPPETSYYYPDNP